MNKEDLHNMYNATSTDDGSGNDELETYEAWLERQLISRIKKLREIEGGKKSDGIISDIKPRLSPISTTKGDFEICFRENGRWAAHDHQLTDMMRKMVIKYNELIEAINGA